MRTTETRDAYLGTSPGGCRFPAFGINIGANSLLSNFLSFLLGNDLIPRGNHGYLWQIIRMSVYVFIWPGFYCIRSSVS